MAYLSTSMVLSCEGGEFPSNSSLFTSRHFQASNNSLQLTLSCKISVAMMSHKHSNLIGRFTQKYSMFHACHSLYKIR